MCKYCEIKDNQGELFEISELRDVPTTDAYFCGESMIARFLKIKKHDNKYYFSQQLPYMTKEHEVEYGSSELEIYYCPFCGRKLVE